MMMRTACNCNFVAMKNEGYTHTKSIFEECKILMHRQLACAVRTKETFLTRVASFSCIGLMIAFIGSDPVSGVQRFTWGSEDLLDGVKPILVMVGLFAVTAGIGGEKQLRRRLSEQQRTADHQHILAGDVTGIFLEQQHHACRRTGNQLGAA